MDYDYNTSRKKLTLPEYGRHIQKMVDHLKTIEDREERQAAEERLIGALVDQARAVNSGGTAFGIDDVIDPAETRAWIAQGLRSVPKVPRRTEKKRPCVDTW